MTPQEKQEIVGEILSALRNECKTVDELAPAEQLSDTDAFEISHGRKITSDALARALVKKLKEQSPYSPTGETSDFSWLSSFAFEAGHAKTADTLSEDAEVRKDFLSSKHDDTANGLINFLKGIIVNSLSEITEDGNGKFQNIKAQKLLLCMEEMLNRITAPNGELILSDSDTIAECGEIIDAQGNTGYSLKMKEKYPGQITPLKEGDIIKGVYATNVKGELRTFWGRVSIAVRDNLTVVMYPDSQVPGGKNYPPISLLRISRWGSVSDTSRQRVSVFKNGTITLYRNVTRPIVGEEEISTSIGDLPDFVKENIPGGAIAGKDYIYTGGIVAKDVIQWGPDGKPKKEVVYRGQWLPGQTYYCGDTVTGNFREVSEVSHLGCLYRCVITHISATSAGQGGSLPYGGPPNWASPYWLMAVGDPEFRLEWTDMETLYDADDFRPSLEVRAMLHNQDVTSDIADTDWEWTRTTAGPDGAERTLSDSLWAANANAPLPRNRITLTLADLDLNGWAPAQMKLIQFTVQATLRDGSAPARAASATITI